MIINYQDEVMDHILLEQTEMASEQMTMTVVLTEMLEEWVMLTEEEAME